MGDEALLAQSVLTGKYTILREIGRGGMATVYLADDLRHRRQVAVKVLHPSLSDIGSDRFTREIGIVAQLQHPHIVPLYDSGESNGHLFYVMPFVEGETLSHRIERTGALPVREATRIAGDIAAALEYAHARGVIHRDIKPSNVLVTADTAVVADFGIARVLTDTSSGALTKTGVVGTPTYMSPEHAEGTTAVGASSDIYALGCVLYEMLTGKPPYAANTFGEMIVKHVAAAVPSVRDARPDVSEHLDAIVQTALAKRVEERWASARELREALEQELADTPTDRSLLAPRRTTARAVKARRRRNAFVGVASIVVASAVSLQLWKLRTAGQGGARSTALNASLMAVAPFDVVGDLELWRDGMVDVLSRNLDGAGPLRTVPPTTIIRAWRRQRDTLRADKVSGATLASRTGAGLVLLGQVVQSGPDSVKVTAQLYDAVRDSMLLADETFKDGEDNVDRLCDSVTVVVLQYLEYKPASGGEPNRTIGARSVQALKAFLQGEQAYRRNDTATARIAYEKAIAEDTGFTLAYRRMRSVTRFDEWDSTSLAWALRAGARNHGLSRRDSLLVLADSLAPATRPGQPGGFTEVSIDNLTRRLAVLTEAARLYPDDPEVWNDIGEMRVHSGSRIPGNNRELSLQAFERALQLDSLFLSAYFHAIELSADLRGADSARKIVLADFALEPRASDRRLVALLLSGRVSDRELRATADTMAPFTVRNAAYLLRLWSDPAESAARVLRYLLAREDSLKLETRSTKNLLRLALVRRGHLREALSHTTTPEEGGTLFFTELAFVGSIPAAYADSTFATWAGGKDLDRAIYSLPWWSEHHDMARIGQVKERCASARTDGDRNAIPLAAAACDSAARGYLALAQGDTALTARLFAGLPLAICGFSCDRSRITGARLFRALRVARGAADLLEKRQPGVNNGDLFEGWWHLERGRVYQLEGDPARARSEFAKLERLWAQADGELKPYVDEARKVLGR